MKNQTIQKTKINIKKTSLRDKNTKQSHENIVITEYHELEDYDDPITCSDAIKWKITMDDEINFLRKT